MPPKRKPPPPVKRPKSTRGWVDEFGLTIRERAFADLYLIDQNASAAYVHAGFRAEKENAIAACASRLLRRAKIASYIADRMRKLHDKYAVTQERVLGELARLAYANLQDMIDEDGNLLPIKSMSEDVARGLLSVELVEPVGKGKGLQTITRKVKLDKTAALRLLGQHLKMFTEKAEISGPGGGPIMMVSERDERL